MAELGGIIIACIENALDESDDDDFQCGATALIADIAVK